MLHAGYTHLRGASFEGAALLATPVRARVYPRTRSSYALHDRRLLTHLTSQELRVKLEEMQEQLDRVGDAPMAAPGDGGEGAPPAEMSADERKAERRAMKKEVEAAMAEIDKLKKQLAAKK